MSRRKVLCFGGSFNPPHQAHLAIALAAKKAVFAHEVWFIPSVQSPLKSIELAPFELRAQMVEALIRPYRKLKVCRIEIELDAPSYTIQTVETLKKRYPDIDFLWLIGSDQASQFDQWKEAQRLKTLIPFVVYRRHAEDNIPEEFIELKDQPIFKEASADIRKGNLKGLHRDVLRLMIKHELYLESIAQAMVTPKRWRHVESMTKVALDLGSALDLDLHVLTIAALFHDCTKAWPSEKAEKYLSFINPEYRLTAPPIWHQKTAAYWMKHHLGIQDQRILQSVAHHVEGLSHHPYAQVIYIADKCDPTRGYDSQAYINMAMKDLESAYQTVRVTQMIHLAKEGLPFE